jgi:hypothetical protein
MDDRRTNYEAPKEFTEKDLRLVGQLQPSCAQHSLSPVLQGPVNCVIKKSIEFSGT